MPVADPSDVKDYAIDWKYKNAASRTAGGANDGTLVAGETVTASLWTVPTGITVDPANPSLTTTADGVATIWLTGGTNGNDYELVNHVTTSQGRQYDQTLTVMVRSR